MEKIDINLCSVLLVGACNQINFFQCLRTIHAHSGRLDVTNNQQYWYGVIIDYENFMQKLSNGDIKRNNIDISIDIELVWRCHLFNPTKYFADCKRQFNQILKHTVLKNVRCDRRHNFQRFRSLLNISQTKPSRTGFIDDHTKMFDAISKQIQFGVQVQRSYDSFRNASKFADTSKDILQKRLMFSINRYDKYLQCVIDEQSSTSTTLIPHFEAHFIWHSHLLNPQKYFAFFQSHNMQNMLDHNDHFLLDPIECKQSEFVTQVVWDEKFGDHDYEYHYNDQFCCEPLSERAENIAIVIGIVWFIIFLILVLIILFIYINEGGAHLFIWLLLPLYIGVSVVICLLTGFICGPQYPYSCICIVAKGIGRVHVTL